MRNTVKKLAVGLTSFGILAVASQAQAVNFGDMMNPSKWLGNKNNDRDYYDRYYGYPGYGYPGYGYGGYPGYGYGGYPGYGYGGYPGYGYGYPAQQGGNSAPAPAPAPQ